MTGLMTRKDVVAELKQMLKGKTLEELARELGYKSPGSLHDVLNFRRAPGKTILARLRLKRERIERYRRVA